MAVPGVIPLSILKNRSRATPTVPSGLLSSRFVPGVCWKGRVAHKHSSSRSAAAVAIAAPSPSPSPTRAFKLNERNLHLPPIFRDGAEVSARVLLVHGYLCVHVHSGWDESSSLLRLGQCLVLRPLPCALGFPLLHFLIGKPLRDHTVFLSSIYAGRGEAGRARKRRAKRVDCCEPRRSFNSHSKPTLKA